jgi:hypothetical protein
LENEKGILRENFEIFLHRMESNYQQTGDKFSTEDNKEVLSNEERDCLFALKLQMEEFEEDDEDVSFLTSHLNKNDILWSSDPSVKKMSFFLR